MLMYVKLGGFRWAHSCNRDIENRDHVVARPFRAKVTRKSIIAQFRRACRVIVRKSRKCNGRIYSCRSQFIVGIAREVAGVYCAARARASKIGSARRGAARRCDSGPPAGEHLGDRRVNAAA